MTTLYIAGIRDGRIVGTVQEHANPYAAWALAANYLTRQLGHGWQVLRAEVLS